MILRAFDYIFYRVSCFYRDRWKVKDPEFYGFGAAFVLHVTTSASLFLIFVIVAGSEYWQYSKQIGIVASIAIYVFDFFRYNNSKSIAKCELQFGGESPIQRRNRGILMKVYAFISIATPIVYGVLKHNLHWI